MTTHVAEFTKNFGRISDVAEFAKNFGCSGIRQEFRLLNGSGIGASRPVPAFFVAATETHWELTGQLALLRSSLSLQLALLC